MASTKFFPSKSLTESLISYSRIHIRQSSKRQSRYVTQVTPLVVEGTIPQGGKGLAVGQYASTCRVFSSSDIHDFVRITGDNNPLHQPLEMWHLPDHLSDVLSGHPLIKVGENDMTKEVVHGILLSSIFSCIFGRLIPGSVYRSQTFDFRRPVYEGEAVVGRVQVLEIKKQRRLDGLIVRCSTYITKEEKDCIRGEAEVWVRHGTEAR